MRLLKCYIQNFGKLQNFSYDFQEGINTIKQDNGFGKTTFATFIKSMFYGLESSANIRAEKSERKKYLPWQGGIYGGNIEFEIESKKYRIERTFGKKASEDTFKLYNLKTNLESNDYTENVGEEIFKINKSAYERSTYIPQGQIQIEMEDSINAKLSNVLESDNDINTSEEALKKLNDAKKVYKKDRGQGGLIDEKKARLFDLQRKLENSKSDIEVLENRRQQFQTRINMIKDLENKRMEEQKLLAKKIELDRINTKKQVYNSILANLKECEDEYNKLDKFFSNGVPTEIFIENLENKNYEIEKIKIEMENYQISEEEKNEIETLQNQFIKGNISSEEINQKIVDYLKIQEIENKIQNKRIQKEEKEKSLKKLKTIKKKKIALIILSLFLIVTGTVIMYAKVQQIVGIITIVVGIILSLYCLLFKKIRFKIETNKKEIRKIEEEMLNLIENKNEINKITDQFIKLYYPQENENKIIDLTNLKTEYSKYEELQKNKTAKEISLQRAISKRESLKRELENGLSNYFIKIDKNYADLIQELKINVNQFDTLKEQLKKAISEKEKFQKENDINLFQNIKEIDESEEEIKQKIEADNKEIDKVFDEKNQIKNQIEILENKIDDNEYIESDIDLLKEEIDNLEEKYIILKKTEELLKESKESFSSNYLNSMISGFNNYLAIIDTKEIRTAVDTNLNVKIEINGSQKEIKNFSAGYKDLIYICMRFSLIDALYKEEKPFVVLDDPFVNLDESKTSKALDIMNEFAKKYQVIYFSCNSSRIK